MGYDESKALRWLYHLDRAREMHAPEPVAEIAHEWVCKLRASMGEDRWGEILLRYPQYKERRDQERQREVEWEEKCRSCEFWIGSVEERANDLVGDLSWCKKHTIETITKPDACPDFRLKVVP